MGLLLIIIFVSLGRVGIEGGGYVVLEGVEVDDDFWRYIVPVVNVNTGGD